MSPALKAFGVLIVGIVAGVILYTVGHWIIGIIVLLGALPVALVAWITAGDRV
ncbi:MAG TPA: hypothetical protein VH420_08475 [Gaiellaceae bacterium]|jgi:hypothetical protein